jgi:hypothetical protein
VSVGVIPVLISCCIGQHNDVSVGDRFVVSRKPLFVLVFGVSGFSKEKWGLVYLSKSFDGLRRIRNAEEVQSEHF